MYTQNDVNGAHVRRAVIEGVDRQRHLLITGEVQADGSLKVVVTASDHG